jgi:hypothetical protein
MWPSGIVCIVLLTASCIQCSVLFFKPKDAVFVQSESKTVECPDGGECPDETTCCLLTTGKYGCCPLPNAVCCNDKEHCCPSGHTCDVEHQQCRQHSNVVALTAISSPDVKVLSVTDVCPDQSQCPVGTCCLLTSGAYGCCPYPQAVCCEDKLHCCPNGYQCNVVQQTCDHGFHKIAFGSPVKAKEAINDVHCPGGLTVCPDDTTCCVLAGGDYGCCPYAEAVCCEDKEHCCPRGYKCNVTQQTCDKGVFRISFTSPIKSSSAVKEVTCPDGELCPDGSTCCILDSGKYGCCPFPQAVCCDDKEHCCPQNHKCNLAQQTCDTSFTLTKKFTLTNKPLTTSVNDVPCPGGEAACPDGNTCCQMSSGQYGCCPLPQAVCCDDHTHCCPEGYKCDTAAGSCLHGAVSVPWSRKVPARSAPVTAVLADVNDCQCKSGSTCCNQKCCPFENAMCCADGLHCCPAGTSCDAKSLMCKSVTNSLMFSWHQMPKKSAITADIHVAEKVDCPDASYCDDSETCCKLTSGGYGCCPLDQAVCCSDGLHCCPHGTQCDVEHSKCVQSDGVSGIQLPWELHSRRRSRRP